MPEPSPEQREYAEMLLQRTASDLAACRVLMAEEDMLDDVVGFHAQQAVEKAIKVALCWLMLTSPARMTSESWQTSPQTTV